MSTDTLREQILREPFKPFIIMLPGGRQVEVVNPELCMFTETGRVLLVARGDRVTHIDGATAEAMETIASDD